ncbi:hypothetical protein HYU17_01280 [Candidatus Woesearchaeota archaeon]|nr:hypothetical protein [Candidatus Woesearchaeota archaeon]
MNLLSRLPRIGKGSYQPDFKVEFMDGQQGLDELVALATITNLRGRFVVGEMKAPELAEPLATVQVYLKPNIPLLSGGTGYALEAAIAPCTGRKLKVASPDFGKDFEVRDAKSKNYMIQTYVLCFHLLPNYNPIELRVNWPANEKGIDLYHLVKCEAMLTKGELLLAYAGPVQTISGT